MIRGSSPTSDVSTLHSNNQKYYLAASTHPKNGSFVIYWHHPWMGTNSRNRSLSSPTKAATWSGLRTGFIQEKTRIISKSGLPRQEKWENPQFRPLNWAIWGLRSFLGIPVLWDVL